MKTHVLYRAGLALLLCCLSAITFAQSEELQKTLHFKTETPLIKEVISEIEGASAFRFSYNPDHVALESVVHLKAKTLSLKEALDLMSNEHELTYVVMGYVIILSKARSKASLNGVVKEGLAGEFLPGAQIIIADTGEGVLTNSYGFFSLSQMRGLKRRIIVKFMGYKEAAFDFAFLYDSAANIALSSDSIQLKEVVMTDDRIDDQLQRSSGSHRFTGAQMRSMPAFAGLADPLKALQFLPGIQGNEGIANFSVRGGSFDQNLFLLDEAPVYNPSHVLGFFSVFNADAVRYADIYKSDIPARYGGKLSSVVDLQMIEGNRKKRTWAGTIGTVASQLMTEGPVINGNEKLSYMAAARYGYPGYAYNGALEAGEFITELLHVPSNPTVQYAQRNNEMSFYDINAKLNFRKSDRDHFYLSVYAGKDHFFANILTNGYALDWGNKTATLRWNHVHHPKLFSNTTAVFSQYHYDYELLDDSRRYLWSAQLQEVNVKQDYEYYANTRNYVSLGWRLEKKWIDPGKIAARDSSAVTRNTYLQRQHALGINVYAEHRYTISPHFQVRYGLRYSVFNRIGPGMEYKFTGDGAPYDSTRYGKATIMKSFSAWEPRISVIYKRHQSNLTLSFDRTAQFLHLLSNASVGLPTDMWMPASRNIKPQFADMVTTRFQRHHPGSGIQWSVGAYWKKMYNTIDFKDNADRVVNKYIESQVLQGNGRAYGFETQVQKETGKFTTNVSYTWSKVLYTVAGINQGREFPTRFDKRHNLSITGNARLSKRWVASLNYVFTTGGAVTMPAGTFMFNQDVKFNYYNGRNAYRLPDYHRLDVSVKYSPRRNDDRKWKGQWVLDVHNVYGRKNPFMLYTGADILANANIVYLFTVVPTLSYRFTF